MTVRLLHLSDLHLGAPGSDPRADLRRRDFERAFDKAVDFALSDATRVHAVLIAGDLFDTHHPPAELEEHVREKLRGLQAAGIPVLIVPGFHDAMAYPDSVYRHQEFPGAYVFRSDDEPPHTIEIDGVPCHFYGRAWLDKPSPPSPPVPHRTDRPGLHVALLHGPLVATDEPGTDPRAIRLSALAHSGMDYVALGGNHNHEVHQADHVTAAYCGTLEATDFAEAAPRALLVVEFDYQDQIASEPRLQSVPYASRRMLDLSLDVGALAARSAADLASALSAHADSEAIARIRLHGPVEFIFSVEALLEAAGSRFFHLEIEDETAFSSSALVSVLKSEPTIRGLFAQQIAQQMEAAGADRPVLEYALKAGLQRFLEGELL